MPNSAPSLPDCRGEEIHYSILSKKVQHQYTHLLDMEHATSFALHTLTNRVCSSSLQPWQPAACMELTEKKKDQVSVGIKNKQQM